MRAVRRLGGAKRWMPHTLGHSETLEEDRSGALSFSDLSTVDIA